MLFTRTFEVNIPSLGSLGLRFIISLSAGCLSKTIEQVGSINNSNNTTWTGNNNKDDALIPKSGANNEANAIGIWITNTYPIAFLILS